MALLLDGKIERDRIRDELTQEVSRLGFAPTLAIVQVGKRDESNAYISAKKKFAKSIGADVRHVECNEAVTEKELIDIVVKLNEDKSVHGILLQLPISDGLDAERIIDFIAPAKDVDGLTAVSVKKALLNQKTFLSATAHGIVRLLDAYKIKIEGAHVVVVGRSYLVGKPLSFALLNRNATVTVCHSKTKNLSALTKLADILVVATGHPGLITKEHVSRGQVVIDVGINVEKVGGLQEEVGERKLVGDVAYDEVEPIVAAISPVPGGVGPMTVAALFLNLIEAAKTRA